MTLAEKLQVLRKELNLAQAAALHAHGDAAAQAATAPNMRPLADDLALLRLRLEEASLILTRAAR